jgi:hypothetical protein
MHQVVVDSAKPNALDRFLSLFASVRPCGRRDRSPVDDQRFVLLTAYYIIKPVREAMILSEAGAEIRVTLLQGKRRFSC